MFSIFRTCTIEMIPVYPVLPRFMSSAAGASSGDGGVDVKMLAEQNVQLKEALKRLHSHSIAEKTDVSALVRTRVLLSLPKCSAELSKRVVTVRVCGASACLFDCHTPIAGIFF